MTTAVHAAIARRFPSPEWATFYEIRDDAGSRARRSADVVAMNTWPSRGLSLHGVEVKVSRTDWLRELRDPSKSAPVQRFCDRWWLAVSGADVVRDGELPETWGLLVLDGKSLKTVKEAPKLDAAPMERGFVAVLLRNAAMGVVPESIVHALVIERSEELAKLRDGQSLRDAESRAESIGAKHAALLARVHAFRDASGIDLTTPYGFDGIRDPSQMGAAVKAIVDMREGRALRAAKGAYDTLSLAAAQAEANLSALRAVLGEQQAPSAGADVEARR